jgi:hypothetical protein
LVCFATFGMIQGASIENIESITENWPEVTELYPRDDINVTTEQDSITTIEDVWQEIEPRNQKNCGKSLTILNYTNVKLFDRHLAHLTFI